MLTNADITIYNRRFNKETRLDEWHKSIILGVRFYVDHKAVLSEKGLKSAEIIKIRIPENCPNGSVYIPTERYQELEDISGFWTLDTNDIVLQGICDMDIEKPSDLRKTGKKYCRIISWSDNRYGGLPHWRIGGE